MIVWSVRYITIDVYTKEFKEFSGCLVLDDSALDIKTVKDKIVELLPQDDRLSDLITATFHGEVLNDDDLYV